MRWRRKRAVLPFVSDVTVALRVGDSMIAHLLTALDQLRETPPGEPIWLLLGDKKVDLALIRNAEDSFGILMQSNEDRAGLSNEDWLAMQSREPVPLDLTCPGCGLRIKLMEEEA